MSVLYKVKGLFALLLALCLLLPLSQCSGISASDTGMSAAAVPASRNQYVFHDARDPLCWGGAVVLLAPLGVVWATRRKPHSVRAQVALLGLGCLVFYVIFRVTLFADLILPGGYLAYVSAAALIYLPTLELWLKLRWFHQPRRLPGAMYTDDRMPGKTNLFGRQERQR